VRQRVRGRPDCLRRESRDRIGPANSVDRRCRRRTTAADTAPFNSTHLSFVVHLLGAGEVLSLGASNPVRVVPRVIRAAAAAGEA
jgi:hypothetical protein